MKTVKTTGTVNYKGSWHGPNAVFDDVPDEVAAAWKADGLCEITSSSGEDGGDGGGSEDGGDGGGSEDGGDGGGSEDGGDGGGSEDGGEDAAAPMPEDETERVAVIAAMIALGLDSGALVEGNDGHFTTDGRPQVEAIEALPGMSWQPSAKDRDAAWKQIQDAA